MKKFSVLGIVLLAGLAFFYLRGGSAPTGESPAPSADVSTIRLVRQTVPLQIPASGSIIAGTAEQNISLAAPGIVSEILARPGQDVAAGQALARITPDAQSIADLRRAQDGLAAAQAARAHVAALLASHLATAADLAAATQTAQDAAASLQVLQTLGTGLAYTIRAPFAGIVTAIPASPGGTSPVGTILFKLAAPGGLVALAGLTEAQAERVTPGDAAMLTALNTNTQTAAIVLQRAAMLDPQTGLVDIILVPQSPLPLGEPLALTITAGSVDGYQVPRDAVLNDAHGDYMYQLDAKSIAHRVTVHVLEAGGAMSVLAPDLNPALPLVTTGAYQLADGMQTQGSGH